MTGEFEYIDQVLKEMDLRMPDLKVLRPDHEHYTTALYQPLGDVSVDIKIPLIRNTYGDSSATKHLEFIRKAINEKDDLVLSPEYCCPFSTITAMLDEGLFFNNSCIAVIGCESLSGSQLIDFCENYRNETLAIWAEPDAFTIPRDKFLDPIIYLFSTKKIGEDKYVRVLIFQFKTYSMGGTPIESEMMALGTRRFIFRNDENSIYLATIICSESLQIDLQGHLRQFHDKPYLLLHPQLNKSPRGNSIKRYRTDFFINSAEDSVIEMICYNWASNSKIDNQHLGYTHSALYTKSKKIWVDDQRIEHNDKYGLHYNFWRNAHASIFIFDDREAVFRFENSKVSRRPLNVQSQARYGPKMLDRSVWHNNEWIENTVSTNNSLINYCSTVDGDFSSLLNTKISSVDRERIICLSLGKIDQPQWSSPKGNMLFEIGDNEYSHRVNVFQDPATRTEKEEILDKYANFASYIANRSDLIPRASYLSDLIGGRQIQYKKPLFNYNVVGSTGLVACIIYAGDANPARINALRSILLKSFPDDNAFSQRILIIYQHKGDQKLDYEQLAPEISNNNNYNPVAINKTKE